MCQPLIDTDKMTKDMKKRKYMFKGSNFNFPLCLKLYQELPTPWFSQEGGGGGCMTKQNKSPNNKYYKGICNERDETQYH